ncbi:MAG: apolipoprotein N-acyltransferase [Actinomycetota bacterium]|nr:apolipoprotein N-acyltransferase [Actinomycetota bacterium]MDQ3574727.1 apolipoprotein N-acyltransferase [Actinomycetota bacterium]
MAALSLPPWGWWPLAFAGTAVLWWCLQDLPAPRRLMAGMAFGVGFFAVGLWWMREFHVLGATLAVLIEASFVALAAVLTPRARRRALALPAALVLAEAARGVAPFGGVPLAGIALGQAGGPLAGAARLGGELLVLALSVLAGVGLAQMARRRWLPTALTLGVVVGVVLLGALSPDGGDGSAVATAVVQGGGRRGFLGVESDPQAVFDAQLAASQSLRPPLSLVLWPEDVIDVEEPVGDTPEGRSVAEVARRTGSTVVAGVIETSTPGHFTNAAVAWSPQGEITARYDKVQRVPFGEYIPVRGLIERVVDVSAVPRDAVPGRDPGVLRTAIGPVGVAISYEVFFASRARAATRAGAHVLTVPTNAASFSSSQVPAQEVAAARLRAIENGRDLLQAAPTGYSAYIDHRGGLLARTTLGRRQVLQRPATMRTGRTVYAALGDGPILALGGLTLALTLGPALRSRREGRGRNRLRFVRRT